MQTLPFQKLKNKLRTNLRNSRRCYLNQLARKVVLLTFKILCSQAFDCELGEQSNNEAVSAGYEDGDGAVNLNFKFSVDYHGILETFRAAVLTRFSRGKLSAEKVMNIDR